METCSLNEEKCNLYEFGNTNISRRPLLRQVFIASGVWASYFTFGLCLGAPTVLIAQIRREANSTEAVSEESESWLSAVFGYGGIPWVFILPYLTEKIGRKYTFILASVNSLIGFIFFYTSTSVTQILISEIIQGVGAASHLTVSIMVITEYTSPKHRGIFLIIKSGSAHWGEWAANAIGTFFDWRNIGIFGFICSSYSIITSLFWPKSPYWLASKGKYEECSKTHRWLKGNDQQAKNELEGIIQSNKYDTNLDEVITRKMRVKSFLQALISKPIYKPILLTILAFALYFLSGKLVCAMYALQIIKKVTGDDIASYAGMLFLDGITVCSMYAGCALSKVLKRRTLLLTTSTFGTVFLFITSLYLYLTKLSYFEENHFISIFLLTMFSVAICSGPMIMASTISGELLPIRFRSTCVCITALSAKILLGGVLHISPYIFKNLETHGAFCVYGVSSTVCIVLLYKYLPETKDKTLQEIADTIKGIIK